MYCRCPRVCVPKLDVLLVMTPKLALSRSESSLERPVEGDLLRLRWTPASSGLCASTPRAGARSLFGGLHFWRSPPPPGQFHLLTNVFALYQGLESGSICAGALVIC